jgi:hypothetical protein
MQIGSRSRLGLPSEPWGARSDWSGGMKQNLRRICGFCLVSLPLSLSSEHLPFKWHVTYCCNVIPRNHLATRKQVARTASCCGSYHAPIPVSEVRRSFHGISRDRRAVVLHKLRPRVSTQPRDTRGRNHLAAGHVRVHLHVFLSGGEPRPAGRGRPIAASP